MRKAAYFLLLLALVLGALAVRLGQFEWDTPHQISEETRHTIFIVDSVRVTDVFRNLVFHFQPGLDYLLRKLFWFQFLGHDERAVRIVSLVYGLAAIGLIFVALFAYFRRKFGEQDPFTWVFAFAGALWLVFPHQHVLYSLNARHYALLALLSCAWFASYALYQHFSRRYFFWLSVAFCNTQFFTLFPVGFTFAYEAALGLRRRDYKYAVRTSLRFLGVLGLTILINHKPFFAMLRGSQPATSFGFALRSAWGSFERFWYTDITLPIAFSFLLLISAIYQAWRGRPYAFLVAFPFLFFFLLTYALKTPVDFSVTYSFPFWGAIPVLFALFAESAHELYTKFLLRRKKRAPAAAFAVFGIGAALLLYSLNVVGFAQALVTRENWRAPRRNFSSVYQSYLFIKREPVPIYVIYDGLWTFSVPLYYLRYVDPPFAYGFRFDDSLCGNTYPCEKMRARIQDFIDHNPKGVFFFEARQKTCKDQTDPPAGKWDGKLTLVKAAPNCLWRLEGAENVRDVLLAMQAIPFQVEPKLLKIAEN